MSDLYQTTIDSVNQLLAEYKKCCEENNVQGLERCGQLLAADKAVLRQIEVEASHLYMAAKDEFELQKALGYKTHRGNGMCTLDATNFSKLDTIPQSKVMHNHKCRRDICRGLMDDLTEVAIKINIALKDARQQYQYGHG